jgi:hypothetical protein
MLFSPGCFMLYQKVFLKESFLNSFIYLFCNTMTYSFSLFCLIVTSHLRTYFVAFLVFEIAMDSQPLLCGDDSTTSEPQSLRLSCSSFCADQNHQAKDSVVFLTDTPTRYASSFLESSSIDGAMSSYSTGWSKRVNWNQLRRRKA